MSVLKDDNGDFEADEGDETGVSHAACYWLNGAGFPTEARRTVVVTGVARSGTSFVAAVAGRLGIPHSRSADDRVSGHWENYELRTVFKERNEPAFARIVSEFDAVHDVWGWKLPSLRNDFEMVRRHVRNPCFIITFKEPLSMAMRKIGMGHKPDIARHFKRIFADYMDLVRFAQTTECPAMLVSYDRALRRIDECIAAVARFGGVTDYDLAAVKAGIEADAGKY